MTTEINDKSNIFTEFRENLELISSEIVEITECPFAYIANLGDVSRNYLFILSGSALSYVRTICDSFFIQEGFLFVIFDETDKFPKTEAIINLKNGLILEIEASDIAFKGLLEYPLGIVIIEHI
jgi:hypothetical protein